MSTAVQSTLIRSNGAQLVTLEGLQEFKAPPPSGRWFPLSHHTVMTTVLGTLNDAGIGNRKGNRSGSRKGVLAIEKGTAWDAGIVKLG